jgi:Leucine-rich repeat (LRR) protein
VLFLNKNKIHELPKELSYLTGLKRINFDHNLISGFAVELGAFEELQHLSIEMNPLSDEARLTIKNFYQIDL